MGGAIPGHHILKLVVNKILNTARKLSDGEIIWHFDKTGPRFWSSFLFNSNHHENVDILILPKKTFYPCYYDQTEFCNVLSFTNKNNTYAMHEWASSWVSEWEENDKKEKLERKLRRKKKSYQNNVELMN